MLLFMKRCISLLWSFKVLWASVSINIWSLRDPKTRTTEEVDRYDNSSDTAPGSHRDRTPGPEARTANLQDQSPNLYSKKKRPT